MNCMPVRAVLKCMRESRFDMTTKRCDYLQDIKDFWQRRASRELTDGDFQEISDTLYEFVEILLDWNKPVITENDTSLPIDKEVS